MRILKFLSFLILTCFIAACSPTASPTATTAPTAESTPTRASMMGELVSTSAGTADPKMAVVAVSRFFYTALFRGEDVTLYVCEAADTDALKDTYLQGVEPAADAVVNTQLASFTTNEASDGALSVGVEGPISVTVGGTETQVEVDVEKIPMVNEGGSWKICG
jgi:hypothetical protein